MQWKVFDSAVGSLALRLDSVARLKWDIEQSKNRKKIDCLNSHFFLFCF